MVERDLLEVMRLWVDERGQNGQLRPWLAYRSEAQSDRAKQSVSVEIEDSAVMGQITLWDTGECEVDLGSTTDSERTLIRSVRVASSTELLQILQEAIHFCEADPK